MCARLTYLLTLIRYPLTILRGEGSRKVLSYVTGREVWGPGRLGPPPLLTPSPRSITFPHAPDSSDGGRDRGRSVEDARPATRLSTDSCVDRRYASLSLYFLPGLGRCVRRSPLQEVRLGPLVNLYSPISLTSTVFHCPYTHRCWAFPYCHSFVSFNYFLRFYYERIYVKIFVCVSLR